jgi:cysteine desulfurase
MRAVAETYLDAASTTPLHPRARAALLEALDGFGDPSRLYGRGRRARTLLDRSREQLAAAVGAAPDEVIVTSGGTEAANLAVTGMARAAGRRRHLVVSAVEHTSVLAPARALAAQGFELTEVGVDHAGRVDPDELAAAVRDDTLLVCLQHANHEVGTVQPVREAAALAHERGALLLVDACQTVGRLPVDLADLGADLLVGSGHKVYGPPGTGFLVASRRARLRPVLVGDERERRRRAGMENLPGVAAMAAAVLARVAEAPAEHDRLAGLADRLLAGLATIPEVVVHGDPAGGSPTWWRSRSCTSRARRCCCCSTAEGIAVHSGSSCTADSQEPSHVLAAMGAITHGSVRVSFLHDATEADVDRLLEVLPAAVADLSEMTELDTQAIERASEGRDGDRADHHRRLPRAGLPDPGGPPGQGGRRGRGRRPGRAARRRPRGPGRHPRLVPSQGPGAGRPARPPRRRLGVPGPPVPVAA